MDRLTTNRRKNKYNGQKGFMSCGQPQRFIVRDGYFVIVRDFDTKSLFKNTILW